MANGRLSLALFTGFGLCAHVFATPSHAADVLIPKAQAPLATYQPAVDGINWKFSGLGGSMYDKANAAGLASVAIPLAGQYGMQFDGVAGSYDSRFVGASGAHLFWRNPAQGLVGIYAAYTHWDRAGGIDVGHVAGEFEAYLGRFSIQGIAGVEFGNSRTETIGNLIESYNVQTRFFDKINFAYYFTDDIKGFVGHRYLGGRNALALGGEVAFHVTGPTMASLFVEGRIGEDDFKGIWGGLRFYVGQKDKSLMRRHREDDPIEWTPETVFGGANSFSTLPVPKKKNNNNNVPNGPCSECEEPLT